MYYLVVLILDNPEECSALLQAWEAAGVRGVTILNSSGLDRVRRAGFLDNVPLMPSLDQFFQSEEVYHRMLMSVVEGEEMIDRLLVATENITGDLNQPNSGFLFAVPVARVKGLHRNQ